MCNLLRKSVRMNLVIFKEISKSYGFIQALNKVDFKIEKGGLYGLIGRNGSGKSTSIKIILNKVEKDSGELFVDKNIRIGYLSEERGLYLNVSVYRQLLFFAKLNKMTRNEAVKSIDYHLKLFGVEKYRNEKVKTLSKGNKQKIQIISALLHYPDFLIMDEPFTGLDPVSIDEVIRILQDINAKGVTILLSCHNMFIVEKMCNDIIVLKDGELLYSGEIGSYLKSDNNILFYDIKLDSKLTEDFEFFNNFKSIYGTEYKLECSPLQFIDICKALLNNEYQFEYVNLYKESLEDIYLKELS